MGFRVELKSDVHIILVANKRGALLRDFDEVVCPIKAHKVASEIFDTTHLPEPCSIGLKIPLDLVTVHSGFQIARVLAEDNLIPSFALRCLTSIRTCSANHTVVKTITAAAKTNTFRFRGMP